MLAYLIYFFILVNKKDSKTPSTVLDVTGMPGIYRGIRFRLTTENFFSQTLAHINFFSYLCNRNQKQNNHEHLTKSHYR